MTDPWTDEETGAVVTSPSRYIITVAEGGRSHSYLLDEWVDSKYKEIIQRWVEAHSDA